MTRTNRRNAANGTPLTPQVVIERALALADAEGLEAVSIRRVAKDLGVTPMALYWHVRSKEQLLDGMADRMYAEIDLTVDDAASWAAQARSLVDSLARVLRAHRAAATLLLTRNAPTENNLRATEKALEILRRAGFAPSEGVQVMQHALSTVVNLVTREPGFAAKSGIEEGKDAQRRTRVFLQSLPPDRYPRIVEAAEPLSARDEPDAYYAFGVDLLLAGIEAMAARRW